MMKKVAFISSSTAGVVCLGLFVSSAVAAGITYPKARKSDQSDVYHGVKVADPYRWLEDVDTPESRAWIEAENKVTFGYLNSIAQRKEIASRIKELWDYEKYGTPFKESNRYFFTKNDGLQNHSVLYYANSITETPKVLIDPNKFSADGTVALSGLSVGPLGNHIAYGISKSGSDWQEWRIREVDTGEDKEDVLKWIKFSGASWTKRSFGFFYSRYDEPTNDGALQDVNYFQKMYYHRLGSEQSDDELVYDRPDDKEIGISAQVTDDGHYIIIHLSKGTSPKNMISYHNLFGGGMGVFNKLIDKFEAQFDFVDNDGTLFWFLTDLNAPRKRLIGINIDEPGREHWVELIPESKDTLQSVSAIGGKFIAHYLKDAHSVVKIFLNDGTFVRDLKLPGIGSVGGFTGHNDSNETFYRYTSFTDPGSVYRYNVDSGEGTVFRKPKLKFNPDDYVTEQIFYKSKDGTRIPMFLNYKKGMKRNGKTPTYLYGYGGFNISITPRFSVSNLVWMEMGGIFAVANIRGGGEYGKEWHEAGTKLTKQNVFDDFIAAAEWLIDNKYTSTPKLAIGGGSNGGLLVGACLTQRPDLYGAALPAVGVMDMLRFQKFTIGWAWTSDYGSADNADEFKALRAYSPVHNLKPGTSYPATMVTTGDHDDRVVPAHSFKFAAALQAAHSGSAPVLIRIETKAGHGAGKPTSMRIEEAADRWSFLVGTLKMDLDHWRK